MHEKFNLRIEDLEVSSFEPQAATIGTLGPIIIQQPGGSWPAICTCIGICAPSADIYCTGGCAPFVMAVK